MAEIANSDSPSPYSSSTPAPFSDDAPAHPEDFPSDVSSILDDTDVEEDDDNDDDDDDDDDDISIDQEEEDDDDEDEEDDNDEVDPENEEDFLFDDEDFEDFDFDMRDVDLDLEGFGFLGDEHLRPGDYLEFPDEQQIDALHHAFLHELEHHFAQEQWALRPHSPIMDQLQAGVGRRGRMHQDELVQVEMVGPGNASGGVGVGVGGGSGAGAGAGGQQSTRQPFANFIDLTGDDDAEMPAQPNPAGQSNQPALPGQSGNQRRLRSQPQNVPPRLNRSDGSYIDDQHVIVLSSSDDEDQPMRNVPRRSVQNNRHNHFNHQNHQHPHPNRYNENNLADRGARNARFGDQLRQPGLAPAQAQDPNPNGRLHPLAQLMHNIPFFQYMSNPPPGTMANRNQNPDDDIVITGERNVSNLPNLPNLVPVPGQRQFLGLGPIQLDYAARPYPAQPPPPNPAGGGGGPPKPVHEPPKPARPGFTRDTGEDVVAICPSCDQELAYDPEGDGDAPPTPAKKSRSKKATAEHHFWAIKACGHVYCKRCFDNRRPSAKSTVHVSFRPEGNGGKKIFCAVEDCDSEVSMKGAWVGIFM